MQMSARGKKSCMKYSGLSNTKIAHLLPNVPPNCSFWSLFREFNVTERCIVPSDALIHVISTI